MKGSLIGIDAGSTNVKVCAFRRDGTVIARASRPVEIAAPRPRWAEINLEDYWLAMRSALDEVLQTAGAPDGVGIACTAPTTILMDQHGRALRPGIPFLDNRGAGELEAVARAVGGADAFFARTGNRLSPSTASVVTLRWLMREEPEIWHKTAHVGFLNSYLAAQLTGVVGADRTQASYTGLFRLNQAADWDADLAAAMGVPVDRLAPLVQSYEMIGRVTAAAAAETGLPAGTPVALGSADTAAAAFALGVREGGESFESAGTSGVITFCLDRPDFDDAFMNRCHVVPGRWLAHGAMSTPGAALDWLREQVWPDLGSHGELERLAAGSEPGARGLVFLPYLAGERSPIWDAAASGAWVGLRLDTRREDMARAVFEGTAYGLRQILERGVRRWGSRPEQLLCVGGGVRSRLWTQIKADILNVAYQIAELPDAAALGAALMGGLAAGVYTGVQDPELPRSCAVSDVVKPGPAERRVRYEKPFSVYESLYPMLRDAMHRLAL